MSLSLSVKKSEKGGVAKSGNAVQGLPWGRRVRAAIAACSHTKETGSQTRRQESQAKIRKRLGDAVDSLGSLLLSVAVPEKTQACGFWLLRW